MALQLQHIYKDQPYAIHLDTETSLETATSMQIRYKKPDGYVGFLPAEETEDGSGILSAVMTGAINDQTGQWELRAWVVFTGDANPVPGTPVKFNVEKVD